jgi:SAM-dependent methyltransferase
MNAVLTKTMNAELDWIFMPGILPLSTIRTGIRSHPPDTIGRVGFQADVPDTVAELISRSIDFNRSLRKIKDSKPNEWWQWYPYDSLSSLLNLEPILNANWPRILDALAAGPLIDVGCGDGDIAYFFAASGCQVTAVDNPPTNYNFMAGVRELRNLTGLAVDIREADIDKGFSIEGDDWGLALILGILYHLKNPFYVLEQLAYRARYCLLSTRVARLTTTGLNIQNEPVAYLLDHREANNDPSNYWIFSEAGLLRLVRRAGWRTISAISLGSERSNPVDGDADERMFLLLRSELRSAPATIRLLHGWMDIVAQGWRWTLKNFGFEVQIGGDRRPFGFLLGFNLPAVITDAGKAILRCAVNGIACPERSYATSGDHRYEAQLPEPVDHTKTILFEFAVVHSADFPFDSRDLGIIMPSGAIQGISEKILFWLD